MDSTQQTNKQINDLEILISELQTTKCKCPSIQCCTCMLDTYSKIYILKIRLALLKTQKK